MLKTLVEKMDSSHCVECLPFLSLSDNQPLDGEDRGDVISSFTVPLDIRLDFSCYFHSVRSAHYFHTGAFCRLCCLFTCFFVLFVSLFIHSFVSKSTMVTMARRMLVQGPSWRCHLTSRGVLRWWCVVWVLLLPRSTMGRVDGDDTPQQHHGRIRVFVRGGRP
jgi:hypothetical protein